MKKFVLVLLALVLFAVPAFGDTSLTAPETQPTISQFRIERFVIDSNIPAVEMTVEFGYDSGGFVRERVETVAITNDAIFRNRQRTVSKSEGADPDIFDTFPAAYQSTPATEMLTQVNGGNFGGQATLKAYLENIVKTLYGL